MCVFSPLRSGRLTFSGSGAAAAAPVAAGPVAGAAWAADGSACWQGAKTAHVLARGRYARMRMDHRRKQGNDVPSTTP